LGKICARISFHNWTLWVAPNRSLSESSPSLLNGVKNSIFVLFVFHIFTSEWSSSRRYRDVLSNWGLWCQLRVNFSEPSRWRSSTSLSGAHHPVHLSKSIFRIKDWVIEAPFVNRSTRARCLLVVSRRRGFESSLDRHQRSNCCLRVAKVRFNCQ